MVWPHTVWRRTGSNGHRAGPSLPQAAPMTRTLATERATSAVGDRAPTDPAGQPVTPTPPLADAPAAPTAAPRETAATSAPQPRLRLLRYEPAATPHVHPFPPPPPGPIPPVAAGLARELTPELTPEVTAAERTQAEQAVGRLLRAALEVLDRRRPSAHIAARVSPPVLRYLQLPPAGDTPAGPSGCAGCGCACPAAASPRWR
jgi:hypothetical protein